jgi:hypothetical protein
MCQKEGRFRARLTPKLTQNQRNEYFNNIGTDKAIKVRVCDFLDFYKRDDDNIVIQSCFNEAIEKHDYFTRTWRK